MSFSSAVSVYCAQDLAPNEPGVVGQAYNPSTQKSKVIRNSLCPDLLSSGQEVLSMALWGEKMDSLSEDDPRSRKCPLI